MAGLRQADTWCALLSRTARVLACLLAVLTLAPLLPTGSWVIRVYDFPRLQIAVVALLVSGTLIGCTLWSGKRRGGLALWLALALGVVAWQGFHVLRFTPIWPKHVATIEAPDIRLLVANVDVRNRDYEAMGRVIRRADADVVLLIEADEAWVQGLAVVASGYPHQIGEVRGEGLGIVLWSRLALRDAEVRYLVSDDRASIHTTLVLDNKRTLRLVGLHPTPPGLAKDERREDGRYDSRIRDAELMVVAREVRDVHPDEPVVVVGDFNDVAWSRTTSLFAKVSGLRDPRVGRGLMNTYHADYPLLRYPLDHVFVSPRVGVGEFKRIALPGSDHFGVLAELGFEKREGRESPSSPDGDAIEDAEELIEEGREDAEDNGDLG